MTPPTASWPATTARPWRKCFSMLPVAGFRRAPREQARHQLGYRAASHQCDDPALFVSVAVVLAAAAGTDLLAGAADHHLGLSANLPVADFGIFRARRRHPDR